MGDRTKLPKWAQQEIAVLEMRLREARAENAQIASEETDTFIERRRDQQATYLPNGTEVSFLTSTPYGAIRVRREGDHVNVTADSPIVVKPWVTNVVKVSVQ